MTVTFDWQGKVGDVWATEWRRTDRSFSELTKRLNNAILVKAPKTGQTVDIGCGAGETTTALARAKPDLAVTGIDLSADLLTIARSQAGPMSNVNFLQGDAAAIAADCAPIDLYISRHGVMFFDDLVAAFSAFRKAASPDGRMIFSCFRDWTLNGFAYEMRHLADNVAPKPDVPGPFAFSDEARVADILTASGWKNVEAEPVDFAYIAGEGDDPVGDAVSFMRRIGPAARAIADAPADRQPALVDELRRICEQHRQGDRVSFPAAAWIWSAST